MKLNKILIDNLDDKYTEQPRGSSVVERWTHNPEVDGATPSPATNPEIPYNIVLGYN